MRQVSQGIGSSVAKQLQHHTAFCANLSKGGVRVVFIVQGKPREAAGIVKVIKDSRRDALRAAKDFLDQGFPFVSIIGDGHVYTIEEFALTIIDNQAT
jgi:hypothetical protein